jgi:[DsrC]-trisulfide reductase subunit J
MRDRGIIWSGLAIFLALATFPVWHNLSAAVTSKGPNPSLPAAARQCVAPVAYMKTSHMRLLLDWRERVVRQGGREFTAFNGQHYNMSLTSTCLEQCHTSGKAEFCDRCHNYSAVSVPCWDCHVDFKSAAGSAK